MLTVVAIIRAEEGQEEAARAALEALIAPTRAEDGCIQYDLHRDHADPGLFIFYENWRDEAALERHLAAPHLVAHGERSRGIIKSADVRRMMRIG